MPAVLPGQLGDASFRAEHGLKLAYLAGAMANGIASTQIVASMARAGMLGFFGAAGLGLDRVEQAIDRLQAEIPGLPFGINLIHSPHEPLLEAGCVELLLRRGVRLIEASAFLDLTLPVVRFRTAGLSRGTDGRIIAPNKIVAKVSRVEVASRFFAPPPDRFLTQLVQQGHLTPDQAEMARRIPVAQDVTAEADSGGHTDNRPAITLWPTLLALRDRLQQQYAFDVPLRVGAAGGIATPASVAAAFHLGVAYVVTGSINQACRESGSSDTVREMLAAAEQADVIMAPAADMFEMGVKLQVLKRGTMFAMRAQKLYELYRAYPALEAIPAAERGQLEKNIFRLSLDEVWRQTEAFWKTRDPGQLERAARDDKHRMALMFRWYLGLSSRWANAGDAARKVDYQVWCGPAMGAFNEWTRGSFLEDWRQRHVDEVAQNLLYGACVLTRLHFLRCQGVPIPPDWARISPLPREQLHRWFA
ncbi:MAG: PfaD family polyunsaturated fatty acid/polyketide biosynthesis protein [Gemmataceae bacterium]